MRTVLVFVFVLMISGCSLTREVPPSQVYRLDPQAAKMVSVEPGCHDRVLRIASLQSPRSLMSTTIYYRDTHARRYQYTRARWQQSPTEQLQQIIENGVSASGLFAGVTPNKSLAKEDWLLEVRVEAMDQQIADDGSSNTVFGLYAVLIDRYSRELFAQKRFEYSEESEVSDVMSAVASWSQATARFETELIRWLETECSARPSVDPDDADR